MGGVDQAVRRVRRGFRRVLPTLQPRPLWMRVIGVLLALFWLGAGWLVTAIFSTASAAGGWLPTAAAFLPGLLLLTLMVGVGRWPGAVAGATAVAVLIGAWAYQTAPPEPERLRAVAADVGVPDGWRKISDQATGNTWGLWNSYPEVRYTFAAAGPSQQVAEEFVARLEADGWDLDEDWVDTGRTDEPWTYQVWRRGRWKVTLNINTPAMDVPYDAGVPADGNRVTVVFE